MTRRAFALVAVLLVSQEASLFAQEAAPKERPWAPSNSALMVPRRRYEVSLFSGARYGIRDDLEIASQPMIFFLLPQAELKFRFYQLSDFAFATRVRLAYLTPFLRTFSRAGALGLLPPTTRPPQAVEFDGELFASWLFARDETATFWLGFALAPHGSTDDLPMLDFPFLYPRFAPLFATVVPRAGLALDGKLVGPLFYGVDLRAFLLPLTDVEGAFAIEQGTSIEYHAGTHVAIELALRTSYARYPIGLRTHFLPLVDLKVGF